MNTEEKTQNSTEHALTIPVVMWRIWFLILAVGYVLQVFSLIIFPITLITWIFGLSDNYIQDYINYTKRVLYATQLHINPIPNKGTADHL